MKIILLIITTSILISCGNNSGLEQQISELQIRNDSLNKIIENYQSKYVYERVFIKHFKTNAEPNKIGSTYKGEFVFVPDVRNHKVQFMAKSGVTKIGYDENNPIIIETNRGDYGTYPFEFKIMSDTTRIFFKPIIRDSLSLSNQNAGYDGTTISDIIVSN